MFTYYPSGTRSVDERVTTLSVDCESNATIIQAVEIL